MALTDRVASDDADVDLVRSEDAAADRRKLRRSNQLRVVLPLTFVWAVGALVLWSTLRIGSIDDAQLLLDPTSVAGLPWYTGLISNLGVLAWTVAAVSAAAAARIAELGDRRSAARFLRQAAMLGGVLMLDDLFLLHSSVFPQALGVSKRVILLGYAVLTIAWAIANVVEIRRTRWGLLAAAGFAVAISLGVDQIAPVSDTALVAEDSAKFLGVVAWATYFALTARDIAESVVRQRRSGGA